METLSADCQSGDSGAKPAPGLPVGAVGRYASWSRRIAGQYGGKRAFLRHQQALSLYRIGVLRRFTRIDWGRVERVIFVCHGNICRSPYCEARGRLLGLQTASLGLSAEENSPASASVAALARMRGVELADHRARTLPNVAVGPTDLLVAMEPSQARQLRKLTAGPQITLLGLWSATPRPYLHDPYGLGQDYITRCLDILDQGVQRIAKEVRQHHAG